MHCVALWASQHLQLSCASLHSSCPPRQSCPCRALPAARPRTPCSRRARTGPARPPQQTRPPGWRLAQNAVEGERLLAPSAASRTLAPSGSSATAGAGCGRTRQNTRICARGRAQISMSHTGQHRALQSVVRLKSEGGRLLAPLRGQPHRRAVRQQRDRRRWVRPYRQNTRICARGTALITVNCTGGHCAVQSVVRLKSEGGRLLAPLHGQPHRRAVGQQRDRRRRVRPHPAQHPDLRHRAAHDEVRRAGKQHAAP